MLFVHFAGLVEDDALPLLDGDRAAPAGCDPGAARDAEAPA
jgi:hypothetical protein